MMARDSQTFRAAEDVFRVIQTKTHSCSNTKGRPHLAHVQSGCENGNWVVRREFPEARSSSHAVHEACDGEENQEEEARKRARC
jgi:hypothetical protein